MENQTENQLSLKKLSENTIVLTIKTFKIQFLRTM